ncbi:PPP2R4 [Symbiodinium pilosum]|uniref:PPP2R4 protein n=1 Tax=Symbiodinium pilosum TaxID=2952 RepID=A0A812WFA1_SYMPI|nr:PPP2R4 [Symbiodinium pilosum]
MLSPRTSYFSDHAQPLGDMSNLVEVIEEWMVSLPEAVFDSHARCLSTQYVLENAPIPDSQRDRLSPEHIAEAVTDSGLHTRLCSEAGKGARVVKITPDRAEPSQEAQGGVWAQQWFGGNSSGSDVERTKFAYVGREADGIRTPEFGSDQSPQHCYDCQDCNDFDYNWEQPMLVEPAAFVQVPMMCTPWGMSPMFVCLSETSGTPTSFDLHWAERKISDLDGASSEAAWRKRKGLLSAAVARYLRQEGQHGSVPVEELLQQHPYLWNKCHSASELARCLAHAGDLNPVVVDLFNCTVRLRTEDEALTAACERILGGLQDQGLSTLNFFEALGSREVQSGSQVLQALRILIH